jgi:hypothetical protein
MGMSVHVSVTSNTHHMYVCMYGHYSEDLFRRSAYITPHIAYYLPKNTDREQMARLATSTIMPPSSPSLKSSSSLASPMSSSSDDMDAKSHDNDTILLSRVAIRSEYDNMCEIEPAYVNGKIKTITAYYGALVHE